MNADRNPSSSDPLDDLLATARWPEPTAASVERLEAAWHRLRRRPQRWGFVPALSAAAAAVVIAVGAWSLLNRETRVNDRGVTADGSGRPSGRVVAPPVRSLSQGREPTPHRV